MPLQLVAIGYGVSVKPIDKSHRSLQQHCDASRPQHVDSTDNRNNDSSLLIQKHTTVSMLVTIWATTETMPSLFTRGHWLILIPPELGQNFCVLTRRHGPFLGLTEGGHVTMGKYIITVSYFDNASTGNMTMLLIVHDGRVQLFGSQSSELL